MGSSLEELGELLEENNLTPADVEYIVNFMNKEDISPQLAMRRIKAFETLKAKLEENQDGKVKLLEEELQQVKNQLIEKRTELENLKQEKSGLESEKEELETKSELIDSEREELQRQLEMIRDMQFEDEEENEVVEVVELRKFQDKLDQVVENDDKLKPVIDPIKQEISRLIDQKPVKFDLDMYVTSFNQFLEEMGGSSEISKVNIEEEKKETKEIITQGQTPSGDTKKDKKQQLEDDIKEAGVEKKPEKDTKEKEEEVASEKKEKKVSEKEEQVLNLFLEFIEEADNDKSFQERVSTICDMDEAYQYLGSIGLSQVYSFASRGIDKKEELQKLLKSWKKDGIPR